MEAYDQAQKIGYFSESAHSNNMYRYQRWTRLQILQTALQFCSKNMPNFHKRRFRYFEGFFSHKLTNIAGFDWVNKRRFSAYQSQGRISFRNSLNYRHLGQQILLQ